MTQPTDTLARTIRASADKQTLNLRKRPRIGETLIQTFLFLCGAISILTTIGIIIVLGRESLNFFTTRLWEEVNKALPASIQVTDTRFNIGTSGASLEVGDRIKVGDEVMEITAITENTITVIRGSEDTIPAEHPSGEEIFLEVRVSPLEFITKTRWNPQIGHFGIWPLLTSTILTSLVAMLVAVPIGLSIAIYLSEYASQRARTILKPTLEVLAGIPTVVYGYFALMFMTPLLRSLFGKDIVEIYNTASAGIVIGILIIPLISSMSEDALSAVPRGLREASYGLGATKLETAIKVVLPAAISGVVAAFIVSISRAIGETMIVALAAGAGPNFTFNPFNAAETMTGHIVRISGGDLSYDSIDYKSLYAIGMVLFVITLSLNFISQRVVRRFREVYE